MRQNVGRLVKVNGWAKRRIYADTLHSKAWYAMVAEHMLRRWCTDRGLGMLLGKADVGT